MSLTKKIVRLHRALDRAAVSHAFGGALALAFCTSDPRATHDIDVNVFLTSSRLPELLHALPSGVTSDETSRRSLQRDGQARLWWDETPVDVFLSNHPFHDAAQRRTRTVPFAGVAALPVLDCTDLAVFKAFFARPKDAVDIASMVEADALDGERLLTTVTELLGAESPNVALARRALSREPL